MAELLVRATKDHPIRVRDLIMALRKAANHEGLVWLECNGKVCLISRVDLQVHGRRPEDGKNVDMVYIVG